MGSLPRRLYTKLRALEAANRIAEGFSEDATPEAAEAADEKLTEQLAASATAMAVSYLTARSTTAIDEVRDQVPGPEESLGRAELMHAIEEAIAERPEPEQVVLRRHYFEDVSLDEIGKDLGLSRSWMCRLHARAIEGVTKRLKYRRFGP